MGLSSNPLVVGNWKMHGLTASLDEVSAIAAAIERGEAGAACCAICPPATLVAAAVARAGAGLMIGGQDCAAQDAGAHTGDIAAEMLRDAGAGLVIVGHSERRADHAETDALVRAKAVAASRAGLLAVVCVGETRAQRDAGDALAVVGEQLSGSVPPTAMPDALVVAYEPVWAIGTGLVPTADDVAAMHRFIRQCMQAHLGAEGKAVRILYGGSVKPDNAASLLGVANVDGALIGGASLRAAEFIAIASHYRRQA